MESIFKLGVLLSVVDAVTGPSTRIGGSLDTLKGKAAALGPAFDKFKTYGLKVAMAGVLIVHMLTSTALATVDTQKALGELASVGVTDMAALEAAGQQFSNQWSGTDKAAFIGAAYDIKSGISSLSDAGVAEFTKLAALTGKATKSTTAEMTSLFATGYGIYKDAYADLSDLQFGELFSAGIAASVQSFKTTGSGMAQAISSLGAAATTAKVPLEEQLSILGMLQATMSGSEAGTKYKALMQSAAAAGQKLNLRFTDANNQLLSMPQILTRLRGKYGDTLDAMEKMEIQKAFGTQEAVAVIDLLYGQVGKLSSNIDGLGVAMQQGTSFTEQMAAAMNQDIGAGIGLLGQQWHNLVEILGKNLIPLLVPLFSWLGRIIVAVQQFATDHQVLTRVAMVGCAVIGTLMLVLGSLATVLGVVGLATPSVTAGFGNIGKAALFLKARLLQMIPAVWGFTAALLANPITWIVLGVVALIAALVWLYKKFEGVRNVVKIVLYVLGYFAGLLVGVGKSIWIALQPVLSKLAPLFQLLGRVALSAAKMIKWAFLNLTPMGWLIQAFTKAEGYLAGLDWRQSGAKIVETLVAGIKWTFLNLTPIGWLIQGFKAAKGFLDGIDWSASGAKILGTLVTGIKWAFLNLTPIGWLIQGFKAAKGFLDGIDWSASGRKILGTLVAGIKSMLGAPARLIRAGFDKIRNLLPFSDAKEGPLSSLTLSGGRIMETLGAGIQAAAPGLHKTVGGALAGVAMATSVAVAPVAAGGLNPQPEAAAHQQQGRQAGQTGGKKIVIQNLTVHLPGVSDAESFARQLQDFVEGYDG